MLMTVPMTSLCHAPLSYADIALPLTLPPKVEWMACWREGRPYVHVSFSPQLRLTKRHDDAIIVVDSTCDGLA